MLLREARALARDTLAAAGYAEAEREAQLIVADLAGREPAQLALHLQQSIDEQRLQQLLKLRLSGQPLQYLLGQAGFMGLTFAVGPGALIPRADTEIIVERAISLLEAYDAPLIADIGTGSGAIALSLAHHLPQARVCGVDISAAALKWAQHNAAALRLSERCRFYQGDLLKPLAALGLRFDLIISNPPYLTAAELEQAAPELAHEPKLALAGGADGLDIYRRLAVEAGPLLIAGGALLLEHGWQQQEPLAQLLSAAGWQVAERWRDYGGRPRGVLARRA